MRLAGKARRSTRGLPIWPRAVSAWSRATARATGCSTETRGAFRRPGTRRACTRSPTSLAAPIVLQNADTGAIAWRAPITQLPSALEWSTDGKLLAVVAANRIVILDAAGRVDRTISMLGAKLLEASFAAGLASPRRRRAPRVAQRGARRRRRPPGAGKAALRRPRQLRRPGVVARRAVAPRRLADCRPVALPAWGTGAGGREHQAAVPAGATA